MTVEVDHDSTMAAAPPAVANGTLSVGVQAAGRYKIVRYVASGAMGEVYAAEDLIIGATVAIKVLKAELTSANAVARLRREIALARKVTNVHVCRVHDVGEHEGRYFLTMELIEGKTLAEHVAATGPLPLDEVERIARQLIDGLTALHHAGIVHRDFKTSNAMLVGSRVVITDFGLARSITEDASLTADGAMLGTPAYMAPEQVQGREATPASDIYALGVILFELLTGARPFKGDTPLAVASARLVEDPPLPSSLRPELATRWDAIVRRCMAREPASRSARLDDTPLSRRGWWGGGIAAVAVLSGIMALASSRESAPITSDAATTATPDAAPVLTERQLTAFDGRARLGSVALSRDGRRIAYNTDDLFVSDLAASDPTRIDIDKQIFRVFDFFPDGQRLLILTGPSEPMIEILDLRDRSFRAWRGGGIYAARLSPSADHVAYVDSNGLMVAPLEGRGERLLYSMAGTDKSCSQLAWSSDGKWIAAMVRSTRAGNSLELLAVDGSRSMRVPTGPLSHIAGVVWSGSERIFYSRMHGGTGSELCSIGVELVEAPRCTRTFPLPIDWLNLVGGRLVFFKGAESATVETIELTAAGVRGSRRSLSGQEGENQTWGFTLDGHVLFFSWKPGGLNQLSLQRPGDATPHVLATGEGDIAVPDGDSIVYARLRDATCELVRVRDKRSETIWSEPRRDPTATEVGACPYLRCSLSSPTRCVSVRLVGGVFSFRKFDLANAREVGPERRRPTTGNIMSDLARVGSTLVWALESATPPAIALLDIDSGAYRELVPKGTLRPHDVSWLPNDAGWLVAGHDDQGAPVIARMRPDGSYETLISAARPLQFHNAYVSAAGDMLVMMVEYNRVDIFMLEGL